MNCVLGPFQSEAILYTYRFRDSSRGDEWHFLMNAPRFTLPNVRHSVFLAVFDSMRRDKVATVTEGRNEGDRN